ncbi:MULTISPECIES: hypothetical protein [Bifidobacterium]|jgi:hypothetical protein|uniref:Uncharacterized protein n=1 Tax=Bifidobacterium tibiigranuli TaxID=2172043 RepID=A0A5N6S5S4_9BIFI|nr:hypothetical protein [Bifidobacterium tibiigranuli]KAE8129179.1 hypothetical protein DDE84_03635 [Bifidobacterium tibiigranuli]KAE8129417.1 hypothetical protein DDF78_03425 [Bifidobacterium tibiigranuli]MCI1210381.1 hypothetical protein [Bifidobacterium tibiigranuli]MCI1221188.1 hypothetical protein [Bifidobacterium tibiigranuli]MCI1231787.1 hypothetical protein [Bifidobacterium tibiigranuli]
MDNSNEPSATQAKELLDSLAVDRRALSGKATVSTWYALLSGFVMFAFAVMSGFMIRENNLALLIPMMTVCIIFIGISIWYSIRSGVGIVHPRTRKAGVLYVLSSVSLLVGLLGGVAVALFTSLHWAVFCGIALLFEMLAAALLVLYGREQRRAIEAGE